MVQNQLRGKEWLSTLRYKFAPAVEGELDVNFIDQYVELIVGTKQFMNEFPELFKKNGKVKNHQVKINLKPSAQIRQQKERRIPIQLQKAVDSAIEGHIERIN